MQFATHVECKPSSPPLTIQMKPQVLNGHLLENRSSEITFSKKVHTGSISASVKVV